MSSPTSPMSDVPRRISLLACGLVFGAAWTVSRPLVDSMGRGLLLMSSGLAAYLMVRLRYRRRLPQITFQEVSRGMILGVILCGLVLMTIRTATPLVFVCTPAAALLCMIPITRRRPRLPELLGTILALVTLCLSGLPGWSAILTALLAGCTLVLMSAFVQQGTPEHLTSIELGMLTLGGLMTMGRELPASIPLAHWGVALALAAGCGLWALPALQRALKRESPAVAALLLLGGVLITTAQHLTGPAILLTGGAVILGLASPLEKNA